MWIPIANGDRYWNNNMKKYALYKNWAIFLWASIFGSFLMGGFLHVFLMDTFRMTEDAARVYWIYTSIFLPVVMTVCGYKIVPRYTAWSEHRKDIKNKLILLCRNKDVIHFFQDLPRKKVVNILLVMLFSGKDDDKRHAVNALGTLARYLGWEEMRNAHDKEIIVLSQKSLTEMNKLSRRVARLLFLKFFYRYFACKRAVSSSA